ncbi:hypothetical protein [Actinoplanes sp. RD1]|uniref:hypothetical protein n=1 Tax=Actinoplanes sp. RD1 TaxID=3064538 RepID=UPI0027414A69|nr:hypothetical protein [Actinoplanes sp. RD1]
MGIEQHAADERPSSGDDRGAGVHPAVAALGRAHFCRRIAHLVAGVVGGAVALGFLQVSVGGDDLWSKAAESIGAALIFASVSAIALVVVRWFSGVERAELTALEHLLHDHDTGAAGLGRPHHG